ERLALCRRRNLELGGRNPDRHDAELFEAPDVMHTARRAGASIGQPFDHEVAFRLDLLLQLDRGQMGEMLLAIAFHGVATGCQQVVESVEEFTAALRGSVEGPDRLAGDLLGSSETRRARRRRLRSRVEENVFGHSHLISLVTGSMLPRPPIDEMMAEYLPAL